MLPNTLVQGWMDLTFLNTDFTGIGDAGGLRGSVVAGSLYVSLHTAWPGRTGNQASSEAAYGSYARFAAARAGTHFTRSTNSMTTAQNFEFPASSTAEDLYFFGVGSASSGSGKLLGAGVLGSFLGVYTVVAADTFTIPGLSGLAVNDNITFLPVDSVGLGTGVTEGTVYFVKTVSGDAVTVSATQGGATLDVTAVGAGLAFRVTKISTTTGGTIPRINSGSSILVF